MIHVESSCLGGSEYTWQKGVEGVLGRLRGGRSLPSEVHQARPQFSKYCFQNESAWAHSLWAHADSIWSWYFDNCGRACFFERLIILLTDPILSHSPNFGRPKQGQKFVVPTFHIHILNPECVRILWVLAPKKIPVENFWVQSNLRKFSIFQINFWASP